MAESRVTSVYVPQHCLQGEEFPVHVLWSGGAQLDMSFSIPGEVSLHDAFNVSTDSGNSLVGGTLRIRSVEVPGYVGLLFKTHRLEDAVKSVQIEVKVKSAEGETLRETTREVLLFRPLIKIIQLPAIAQTLPSERGRSTLKPRLKARNVGDGTAVVIVRLKGKGKAKIVPPEGMQEFEQRFAKDAAEGFSQARTEFKKYGRLLTQFIKLVQIRRKIEPKDRAMLRRLNKSAQRAYEESPELKDRVVFVVAQAWFNNLEIITEVGAFLDYLNSIGEGRVIVANSLDVLRLPAGETTCRFELKLTDAALNGYPTIPLEPIAVVCKAPSEVPIHALFDWCPDTPSEAPDGA